MNEYSNDQVTSALQVVSSTIINCQRMQPKFKVGSSQHTLLKNRIQALQICQLLMQNKSIEEIYSFQDLEKALAPIVSIIHKCKKAQSKAVVNSSTYKRLDKLIQAMYIAKAIVLENIDKNR